MKKLFRTIMVLSVASALVVSSCSKKDDTPIVNPTITPVGASISIVSKNTTDGSTRTLNDSDGVYADDSLSITLTGSGNANNMLTHAILTFSQTGATDTTVIDEAISGTNAGKSTAHIVTGSGYITYTGAITGAVGSPASARKTVKILKVSSDLPLLGNQASTNPRFWGVALGTTTDLNLVAATPSLASMVDFGYCSRTTGNKIISPSSADATAIYSDQWSANNEKITQWSHRNLTTFKFSTVTKNEVAVAQTNAQISALIQKAINAGDPPTTADNITVTNDQVILFKTEAGKYGLILIVSATGSVQGSAQPGDAQIEVLYQK